MSIAPRSPRKIFIALLLFLAALAWSLMQTNEYFVNGKGLGSDWLNPRTWVTPLSNHEALGQVGFNVGVLTDVSLVDSRHGWTVGGGVILATDDGGQSWRQQQSGVKTSLYAIQFTDPQHGWAVGHDGIILVTDNGGQSWRPQQSGVKTVLWAVQFTDPQHGWAVGDSVVILATDDGGQSWRKQHHSSNDMWLHAVQFTDPQHGWAVGGPYGVILATDNGGQSWRLQHRGASAWIRAFELTDPSDYKIFAEGRPKLAVFPGPLAFAITAHRFLTTPAHLSLLRRTA